MRLNQSAGHSYEKVYADQNSKTGWGAIGRIGTGIMAVPTAVRPASSSRVSRPTAAPWRRLHDGDRSVSWRGNAKDTLRNTVSKSRL